MKASTLLMLLVRWTVPACSAAAQAEAHWCFGVRLSSILVAHEFLLVHRRLTLRVTGLDALRYAPAPMPQLNSVNGVSGCRP